ncbi:GLEYA domain-containing protein [Pochonia chlamydosporia 170]|uniref:GLEYA domain-containing protein n=1 Tax=Pochonia chlamydosporia 170 TaxID=1380566 RepID=A0A179F090_METCM|nr:GLEYA domain-containing protein [Pochonia chlamydosporia 170]OAQ58680.1 GLEYA domain-containing protein [Pochonia chlamydosporia 170]
MTPIYLTIIAFLALINLSDATACCAHPRCGEPGFKFAQYNNPFLSDHSPTYDKLNLTYFSTQQPIRAGISSAANNQQVTGDKVGNWLLNYRAFLYTCHSGNYTFASPAADDVTLVWLGKENVDKATQEAASLRQYFYGDNSPKTVHKELEAGVYYPIRIVSANGGGPMVHGITILDPKGRKVDGATSHGSSFLLTEACGKKIGN